MFDKPTAKHEKITKNRFTKRIGYDNIAPVRGISAVGSAQHWQCWGQEFESPMLHKCGRLDFQGLPLLFVSEFTQIVHILGLKNSPQSLMAQGLEGGHKRAHLYQDLSHFLRKFKNFNPIQEKRSGFALRIEGQNRHPLHHECQGYETLH